MQTMAEFIQKYGLSAKSTCIDSVFSRETFVTTFHYDVEVFMGDRYSGTSETFRFFQGDGDAKPMLELLLHALAEESSYLENYVDYVDLAGSLNIEFEEAEVKWGLIEENAEKLMDLFDGDEDIYQELLWRTK